MVRERIPEPTAPQLKAWPAIKAHRHTLIAAPTGSGKTLSALHGRHRRPRPPRHRDAAARRNDRRLRLAAESAVQRHPHQPRSADRGHPRQAARDGPARCRNPHRRAHRRHAAIRTRRHAPPPAAHRGDDARVAVHPARLRIRPRDARHHAHGDRRRNPRHHRQQARRASGAVAGTPRSAVRTAPHAHRPVGDAETDQRSRQIPDGRRRRPRLRNRRHRLFAQTRSGRRSAARAAAGGDVGRRVGTGLCAADRTRAATSHHAHLRQHAPHGRTRRAPSHRETRQGCGHLASRQHVARTAPRRRTTTETRRVARAGRDVVARTRHRRRRCRSGLPAQFAAFDFRVPATRRPFGPRRHRHAERTSVSAIARRSHRMRRAARQRAPRRTRRIESREERARRARAADRRRSVVPRMERAGAVRSVQAQLSVRRTFARSVHRHPAHARRRLHDAARPALGVSASRCGERRPARAQRRAS